MAVTLFKRFPTLRTPDSYPVIGSDVRQEHPALAEDFAIIERVLDPAFDAYDASALHNQNLYRRQNVIVLLGATVLASLGGLQAVFENSRWPSLALVVLGVILASSTKIAGESDRLQRYLTDRAKAERLRGLYFLFLSRTGAYAEGDREAALRRTVRAIQRGEEAS